MRLLLLRTVLNQAIFTGLHAAVFMKGTQALTYLMASHTASAGSSSSRSSSMLNSALCLRSAAAIALSKSWQTPFLCDSLLWR